MKRVKKNSLKPYFQCKKVLSVEQGCVFWGLRVVVVECYQAQSPNELYEQHHRTCRMKSSARSYLWWPGLDSDVESFVQSCDVCQTMKNCSNCSTITSLEMGYSCMAKNTCSFCTKRRGLKLNICAQLQHKKLRKMFLAYGLAEELVCDNGPQFSSSEFQLFLKQNGITHTLVPPYHPASYDAAQRTVQIVIKTIMAQVLSVQTRSRQLSFEQRLASFLLIYRSTPHTMTGCSPAELFMKRQ